MFEFFLAPQWPQCHREENRPKCCRWRHFCPAGHFAQVVAVDWQTLHSLEAPPRHFRLTNQAPTMKNVLTGWASGSNIGQSPQKPCWPKTRMLSEGAEEEVPLQRKKKFLIRKPLMKLMTYQYGVQWLYYFRHYFSNLEPLVAVFLPHGLWKQSDVTIWLIWTMMYIWQATVLVISYMNWFGFERLSALSVLFLLDFSRISYLGSLLANALDPPEGGRWPEDIFLSYHNNIFFFIFLFPVINCTSLHKLLSSRKRTLGQSRCSVIIHRFLLAGPTFAGLQ